MKKKFALHIVLIVFASVSLGDMSGMALKRALSTVFACPDSLSEKQQQDKKEEEKISFWAFIKETNDHKLVTWREYHRELSNKVGECSSAPQDEGKVVPSNKLLRSYMMTKGKEELLQEIDSCAKRDSLTLVVKK